ncbi:DUF3152 domain-containing protein [Actinoplanes sp. HUAS TT8]|uniref:DUF3152 domain-containing protein n=1 Tax=Actinoplanes sp. HUAS TT8 TaxID=3447453 RepID=UPI003F526EAB
MHAAEDREDSGGRHRRGAERLDVSTGRHRMSPENPVENPAAKHRADQQPTAHDLNSQESGIPKPSGPERPLPPGDAPTRHSAARHAQPQPARPPVDPETGLPPGMTRGILELAAERLAASRSAQPADDGDEPEAEEPEPADETPRPTGRRPGRSAGGPGLRGAGTPAAGTRPGTGSRPPLASRPPAGPPEAMRPPTTQLDPPQDPPPPVPPAPAEGSDLGQALQSAWPTSTRRPRGSRPAVVAEPEDDAENPPLVRPIRAGRPVAAEPIEPVEPIEYQPDDEPDPAAITGQPDRSARRRPIVRTAAADVTPDQAASTRPDFYRVPDAGQADDAVPTRTTPSAYATPDEVAYPMTAAGPEVSAPTPYAQTGLIEMPVTEVAEPETEDETWFWSTTDHPAPGLPESLRLPVGIPEGLWHPAEHEPPPDDRPTREQVVYSEPAVTEVEEPEPEPEETRASLVPHQPLPTAGDTPLVEIDRTGPPPDPDGHADIRAKMSPAGRKLLRRRRRVTFMAYLMAVSLVLIVGHELRDRQRPVADRAAEPIGAVAPPVDRSASPDQENQDQVGSVQAEPTAAGQVSGQAGDFRYVNSRGPVLGKSGQLHRFRVAVEETVSGVEPKVFARAIDSTLSDKRSWIASGKVRLRRVPKSAETDFTIYLASAATSERMCAAGGLHTEGFTSCRVPGQVIINADRWADATPDYEGELWEYRQYALNHEVGHELGHGHEACPGKGKPAPVMLQQTYGLDGCTRNAWPFLDGERYEGDPRP